MLVLITIASLAVAATMSIVAWRLAREARERSEARVAALVAAIDDFGDRPPILTTRAAGMAHGGFAQRRSVPTSGREPTGEVGTSRSTDRDQAAAVAAGMFATSTREDRSARHFGPAFVLGALAVSTLVGTLLLAGGSGGASSDAAGAPSPLELLSLRHVDRGDGTEVSGLVRNPRGAAPIERVVATVFFYDGAGAFLSSARAPLDFRRLSGGEESPFVVTAPTPPGVRRYRVSFRLAEGGVVPHVDRREK